MIMKTIAKPKYALALFILFVLASARLLASVQANPVKSLGAVDVGGRKVVVTFDRDESEKQDPRRAAPLSEQGVEDEARRFARVVLSVGEIARGLQMPERVHFSVAAVAENPSAESFSGVIKVGRTLGAVDEKGRLYTQHPNEMLPVIAHEFGHMVFHENILMELDLVRRAQPAMRELVEIEKVLNKLYARIEELAKSSHPRAIAEAEKVEREIARWTKEAERAVQRIEPVLGVLDATTPYNEFYADVIAVLYSGKPNSVAQAIHIATPARGGSAERRFRRSEIRNRQFSRRGTDRPLIVASPHAVFYQAREMIWDEFLKRPNVMNGKKNAVLHGVTRAVRAEVRWLLSQPAVSTKNPDALLRMLNKRLGDRIRVELSSL